MMKQSINNLLFAALIIPIILIGATTVQADQPNIVFIMADDLGWADVGYNGTEFYETPNIDALSKAGMTFSNSYPGAANCLPSRSCIMSGMYTPRTKMWQPGRVAKGNPALMRLLVPNESKKDGDGKIRTTTQLDPSITSLAEMLNPAGYKTIHFGKWHLGRDGQGFDINDASGQGARLNAQFYGDENVAQWLTDAAVKSIGENKDQPFFLYLCHWDVHVPINARQEVVQKYREKKRTKKQWSQDWDPVYAAMVQAVDTSVGAIWQALKDNGLEENTILIFTSDNGGHGGATWNAPLKGSKGGFYEGGIRVPLVMHWPDKIKARSGCETPVTGVDYMPTFAELAGAELPDPKRQPQDGVSIVPLMTGKPITERAIYWHYPMYLSGKVMVKPVFGTKRMQWRATPCSVMRQGDWKLMQFFENNAIELYNVKSDIGEMEDVSKQHPEKVARMLKELEAWQVETGADIPSTLNPDFAPPSS